MDWVSWIVVGLIAGFLAKVIMPGARDEPGGWIGTILLGIVGAVVGGFVWNTFFNRTGATGINLPSIIVALVGSMIVIGLLRLFDRRGTAV